MKLFLFEESKCPNPLPPYINLNYTHARTYERIRASFRGSLEPSHLKADIPQECPLKMAPCARDGAWQIRGEATRRQLTHFSVIIQPAKRGLGSNQAFLFKSILELEAKPATIFPGLDASITSASFGGGSVFRRAEGTSAVTVRGRWMRPPVCRETSVPIPTSLNHLVSRKTLFFFFDSLLPRFFPFRGTALLFVSSAKQRYFGGPTEWFRVYNGHSSVGETLIYGLQR